MVAVRHGINFSKDYVTLLGRMVKRHSGEDLITLTDQGDTPGETVPLRHGFHGWWAKFELFSPELEYLRPFVYFDLDTYILGDIRDIRPDGDFWMLADFNRPKRGASGMMIIPKNTEKIWEHVKSVPLEGGDQDYLSRHPHRKLQDRYEGIVSYKNDVLSHNRMGRIVCFHGRPRPHECDGWARDVWESVGNGDRSSEAVSRRAG